MILSTRNLARPLAPVLGDGRESVERSETAYLPRSQLHPAVEGGITCIPRLVGSRFAVAIGGEPAWNSANTPYVPQARNVGGRGEGGPGGGSVREGILVYSRYSISPKKTLYSTWERSVSVSGRVCEI